MEKYYNPKEIAELLSVSEKTIRRYIKSGKIKAIKIGSRLKISESNYMEFVNSQKL